MALVEAALILWLLWVFLRGGLLLLLLTIFLGLAIYRDIGRLERPRARNIQ